MLFSDVQTFKEVLKGRQVNFMSCNRYIRGDRFRQCIINTRHTASRLFCECGWGHKSHISLLPVVYLFMLYITTKRNFMLKARRKYCYLLIVMAEERSTQFVGCF